MSESRDEVKRFHELEQEGLRRATDRDKPSKGDAQWFVKVQDAINQEMRPYFQKMGEDDWNNFLHGLANAAYYGSSKAKSCEYSGEHKEDCPATGDVFDYLKQADYDYSELSNRPPPVTKRCTHFVGNIDKYKLHHAINDTTACLHRGIEHYEETARAWHKDGKCMWRE